MIPVKTLTLIAQLACIAPILVGILRYRNLPPSARVLFYFMLYCGFTEWYAHHLAATLKNNMPPLYLFTFIEFTVFSYVLIPQLVLLNKWSKQALWGLILLMLGLLITDMALNSIYKWPTVARTAESILIVFMSLAYILQYVQESKPVDIYRDYTFWIAAGAGVYFSISFFFTLISIMLTYKHKAAAITTFSHLIASILSYLLFALSFWVTRPIKKD